jgi:hypothetical protein
MGERDGGAALLSMDLGCLGYLHDMGGSAPTMAIPAKLFGGPIPEDHPNLVDLGMIEHIGDLTFLTERGRNAIAAARTQGSE